MHTHICTIAQAAVFKNLYYNWQDYKNFISSYNEDDIESAISNFESQIKQLQTANRERKSHSKPEEDPRSLMPRFETAAEREERLRREQELAEFGKVAVAFRLSSPDPKSYTYCTELPAKFYTEEELLELRKQQNRDESDSGIEMQRRLQLSVDFQSDKLSGSTDTETTPPKQHSYFHSKPVCSSSFPSTSSKYRKDHIPRGKKSKKQPLVASSRFLPHTAIGMSGTQV